MIIPTKYEDLNYNLFVLGAHTIRLIKKNKNDLDTLFRILQTKFKIDFDTYTNILTLLWLLDLIKIDHNTITFEVKNDTENTKDRTEEII